MLDEIATIYEFYVRLNYVGTDRHELVTCATESRETRDHFCPPWPTGSLNVDCYTSQPLYIAGIPHKVVHKGIAFENMESFLQAWKMKIVCQTVD